MSLTSELSNRNQILEKIKVTQNIISGESNKYLVDKISAAKKDRDNILDKFKSKQSDARTQTDILTLKKINDDLVKLCDDLTNIDDKIKKLQQDLDAKNKLILSKDSSEYKTELDKLLSDLDNNSESLSKEREKERQSAEEDAKKKKLKGLNIKDSSGEYDRIYIDENFGIYIDYPKKQVIAATMKSIFAGVLNTVPDGYSKDDVLDSVSNTEVPGLASLLSVFIDILIQAIGQGFVKNFFFFKNTIDKLAGLELGELLATYIPGIPKIIQDLQLLLTDAPTWIFKNLLGPLFDINIPIPEFNFDLGALVPFLPFNIKIPKIDANDYFTKLTPFNLNICNFIPDCPCSPINLKKKCALTIADIPDDWVEKLAKDRLDALKDEETLNKQLKIKKLKELDDEIQKLQDLIKKINKYTKDREKSEMDLYTLNSLYESLKIDVSKNSYVEEQLIKKEKELIDYCKKIDDEKLKLQDLINLEKKEQEYLDGLNIDDLKEQLDILFQDRNEIKDLPDVTVKQFQKRALLLSYEQSINQDDLKPKLSELWFTGINVFDNEVTEYLQKLGYSFSSDNYITKLKDLKHKYGFKFNNSAHMKILYNLGFNMNDPEYLTKLSTLKKYKISILNSSLLVPLMELGMNFNNSNFYDILDVLFKQNINMSDLNIVNKLNNLGFNFNNTNIVDRLNILSKYIDLSDSNSYDNALSKNINLNNPYFEEVLKRYSKLGLTWNKSDFKNVEKEILQNVKVQDIDQLLKIIEEFKDKNNNINLFNYVKDDIGLSGSTLSGVTTFMPNITTTNKLKSFEKLCSTVGIPTSKLKLEEKYYPLENTTKFILDKDDIYKYSNSLYINDAGFTKIQWVNIFSTDINKYEKYGIKLNVPTDVYKDNIVVRKFLYPDNYSFTEKIDGKPEIQSKLELLRLFVVNKGWVIDGIRIGENFGETISEQIDYERIVKAGSTYNLEVVDSPNTTEGQVSYDQLQGLYGNFDKLGLNIRDNNFDEKIKYLTSKLKIKVDESTILDTKTNVLMTYHDGKNILGNDIIKTIDLKKNKIPTKILQDEKYKSQIKIVNIADTTKKRQPTKTIVQFDSINKMGFNFQRNDYKKLLDILNSNSLNMSAFETSHIVDALCSIGWHFNCKDSIEKILLLDGIGFSFNVDTNMQNKLSSLNNFGFNFNKKDWRIVISEFSNIGLRLSSSDFENSISALIGFGINLNDKDWRTKLIKIRDLGINFRDEVEIIDEKYNISFAAFDKTASKDPNTVNGKEQEKKSSKYQKSWIHKFSNLRMLGVDFTGKDINNNPVDWLIQYNKALSMKKLGIDYNDVDNRQKLAILSKIGVDFNKPEDEYMQKIESLVQLRLINIPKDVEKLKSEYESKRNEEIQKIDNRILYLKKISSGDIIIENDNTILKLIDLQNTILNDMTLLKNTDTTGFDNLKIVQLNNNYDKKCKELKIVNDKINKLKDENKNLKSLNKEDINKEISELEDKKLKIQEDKVYLLNKDIFLEDLDKFKALDKIGVNFHDPNWRDILDCLLKYFNFSMPNWKDLLPTLVGLIPINPVLEWIKGIINIIVTVITMPIKTLVELIKKFIDIITQVLSIPLNPTKIPEWAKGIITKFTDLVKLITGLPTLDGLIEFLFLAEAGLKLIDMFVPGFAEFMSKLKALTANFMDESNMLKKQLIDDNKKLNDMSEAKIKRINEINNDLNLNNSILNGKGVDILNKLNDMLRQKILILSKNIDNLKLTVTNSSISEEAMINIEKEMQKNCDEIDKIEEQIKNNIDLINKLMNKTPQELNDNIDSLNIQKETINTIYDTDSLEKSIKNKKEKIGDLEDKSNSFGSICKMRLNIDKLVEMINNLVKSEKDKKNPYDDQSKENDDKKDKLKTLLDKIQKNINSINSGDLDSDEIKNLNKLLESIYLQIKMLEDDLCANRLTMSDDEFNNKLKELERLKKYADDIKKDIETKRLQNNTSKLDKLLNDKLLLEDELLKTEQENKKIKELKNKFDLGRFGFNLDLDNICKWLPVIINILCCTPKFIVNIFVGLLNAVGHMNNLPSLWEFPLLEDDKEEEKTSAEKESEANSQNEALKKLSEKKK